MRRLIAAGRQRGTRAEERLRGDDRHLIALTERVLHQAQEVPGLLGNISGSGWRERETLTVFIPRVEQVSTQARRRVLAGESVPASAKAVRIFEPHTAVIRKGKPGHPVEFGRVVWLDEVEGGIVSRYAVLAGNPDDAEPLAPALDHHMQRFGDAPRLLAGDRKVSSREGERSAHDQAVRRVVLPHSGRGSAQRITYERQRWFQRGRRWRTGIEGRISVRKRRHKLTRCRYHGSEGMARWVGWGVITHNLRHIAEALSSTDADAARHPIPRAANPAASSACRFRTAK
jgi:IS5 family transposase